MLRPVSELKVDVNEGALDLGQLLELLLERLANVVRLAQRHVAGEDDVNLDKVVVAECVRTDRVDVLDLFVMVPDQVGQFG